MKANCDAYILYLNINTLKEKKNHHGLFTAMQLFAYIPNFSIALAIVLQLELFPYSCVNPPKQEEQITSNLCHAVL